MTNCDNIECIWCINGECMSMAVDLERRNEEPELLMCNSFEECQ